jgi:hypothetical protein
MRNQIMLDGLKKKDTYDSLVEYLDGGKNELNIQIGLQVSYETHTK